MCMMFCKNIVLELREEVFLWQVLFLVLIFLHGLYLFQKLMSKLMLILKTEYWNFAAGDCSIACLFWFWVKEGSPKYESRIRKHQNLKTIHSFYVTDGYLRRFINILKYKWGNCVRSRILQWNIIIWRRWYMKIIILLLIVLVFIAVTVLFCCLRAGAKADEYLRQLGKRKRK